MTLTHMQSPDTHGSSCPPHLAFPELLRQLVGGPVRREGRHRFSLLDTAVKSQCPKEPRGHLVPLHFSYQGGPLWQCPNKWWLKLGTHIPSGGDAS